MKRIFVLYDGQCGFCVRNRRWLGEQHQLVRLVFFERTGAAARERFGPLLERYGEDELVCVDDEGGVYSGTSAFLICLWALRDYREWAARLGNPRLRPLVRQFFSLVSRNRALLSRWFGATPDEALAEALRREMVTGCDRSKAGSGG